MTQNINEEEIINEESDETIVQKGEFSAENTSDNDLDDSLSEFEIDSSEENHPVVNEDEPELTQDEKDLQGFAKCFPDWDLEPSSKIK